MFFIIFLLIKISFQFEINLFVKNGYGPTINNTILINLHSSMYF